jgi:hypothetical protein
VTRIRLAALSVCLLIAGCGGGPKYVKVSGVVKLNGQPYKNAVVTFQPMSTGNDPNPGRGSSGITDENGRYELKTDEGQSGAAVGKHRVRIVTKYEGGTIDPQVGSPDRVDPRERNRIHREPIPAEWHSNSNVEFEVPPGGTDHADFDIQSKAR